MKKAAETAVLALAFALAGCSPAQTAATSQTPAKQEAQGGLRPDAGAPKTEAPAKTEKTVETKSETAAPAQERGAALGAHEGQWETAGGVGALSLKLQFTDGKYGKTALAQLDYAYPSITQIVDGEPAKAVFSESGIAEIAYKNSFGGEGKAKIELLGDKVKVTVSPSKKAEKDYPAGTATLLRKTARHSDSEKELFALQRRIVAEKAKIPAREPAQGSVFPLSDAPDAVTEDQAGRKIYAWKAVEGGAGDGNAQKIHFFMGETYLGADTEKAHKQTLAIIGGEGAVGGTFSVRYAKTGNPFGEDLWAQFRWDGKKMAANTELETIQK